MPLCKNCPHTAKVYYTGKENTPLGRGISARFEKLGQQRKGKDGNMYLVVKVGDGKRWKGKSSSSRRKTSPRMDLDHRTIEKFMNPENASDFDESEGKGAKWKQIITNMAQINMFCKHGVDCGYMSDEHYTTSVYELAALLAFPNDDGFGPLSWPQLKTMINTYGLVETYDIIYSGHLPDTP